MIQRNYHQYILILAIALVLSGCLTASAIILGWGWPIATITAFLSFLLIMKLWDAASFIPNQVESFLSSLLNKDSMTRFPLSNDKGLQQMYQNMNRILVGYSQTQLDLETKRMYYDRILRIMTHELRNSITPLITLSEDMMTNEYTKEDSNEAISVINEQCTAIKHFLDSYYELTHLPKPEIKEVDVKSMLQHLERLYSGSCSDKMNITFICAQGMKMMCDEKMIGQVMNNLIKNAIEIINIYGDGKIGEVTVTASSPNGKSRITVSDNGPGIPSNKLEEIFLPFYTSKPGGSGIGLSISRQILQLHGGTLSCYSTEGEGATFVIDL
ncbi:MAG: HAMP domain-containing histidine kinase [Bacteroidales bacterium]|nr:HAMP domain-containing histidine kinase [Bacteroidales bacterium]